MPEQTPPQVFGNLPYADPGHPDTRSVRRLFLWLTRRSGAVIATTTVLGIFWQGSQALVPVALGQGIQAVAAGDADSLRQWAMFGALLAVIQIAAGIMRHRLSVKIWLASASNAQQAVSRHARDLGADLPAQVATGEVISVTASDVDRVGASLELLPRFLSAIIVFFAVATALIVASPILGIAVAVGVPILILGIGPLLKPLEKRESVRREKLGKTAELAADIVGGLRVLRGIGGEEMYLERFRKSSQDVRAAAVRVAQVRSLMHALQVMMPGIFVLGIMWGGATLVQRGTLSVGQLITFYGMSAYLAMPLRGINQAARVWTASVPAFRRLNRLLNVQALRPEPANPEPLDATGELIDTLSGVRIHPGRLTVIACDNPDTADLIADRLGGFRDADDVTLSGLPLSRAARTALRQTILVQDKDPILLSGTISELLDIPGTDRLSLDVALTAASAWDVLDSLDGEGMDAVLVERGRTLSGGQRQRLALVRSLMMDPPILVLDEPTSAVDTHTEARIASAINAIRANQTTVILTTSPLLLDRADDVILVMGGKVAAQGRHADLVHSSADYRNTVVRDIT
jgi:ABC-type multidrug transport system fused ATPase/permease subunit